MKKKSGFDADASSPACSWEGTLEAFECNPLMVTMITRASLNGFPSGVRSGGPISATGSGGRPVIASVKSSRAGRRHRPGAGRTPRAFVGDGGSVASKLCPR